MSFSEITQSHGALIFDFETSETNPAASNFSEIIEIDQYNTHSYHFSAESIDSDFLNCSISVWVSNYKNPLPTQWSKIFRCDFSGSYREVGHYKDIYNFARTRVQFEGKGIFKLSESHTPIYRRMKDEYGKIYAPCDSIDLKELNEDPHAAIESFARLIFPEFDSSSPTLKSILYNSAILIIKEANNRLLKDLPLAGCKYGS